MIPGITAIANLWRTLHVIAYALIATVLAALVVVPLVWVLS